jgi:hypothetical protein
MPETQELADSVFSAVQKYLARETQALVARLEAAEQKAIAAEKRADDLELKIAAIPAGPQGEKGDAGPQGEPGEKGEQGMIGERGEQGEQGVDGIAGPEGLRGEKGDAGERGDKGDIGAVGEKGEPGLKGEVGERGLSGERGIQGERGDIGARGDRGEKGEQGERGLDGIEIKILSDIDVNRSYPKGTYAIHEDLFMRADRSTSAVVDGDVKSAGWLPLFGETDCDVTLSEDGRTAVFTATKVSGRVIEKRLSIPAVIDRGVYKADRQYVAGDGCTWNGSFWIAQRETSSAPNAPGCEDWRLAVKRGQDGKSSGEQTRRTQEPVKLR